MSQFGGKPYYEWLLLAKRWDACYKPKPVKQEAA